MRTTPSPSHHAIQSNPAYMPLDDKPSLNAEIWKLTSTSVINQTIQVATKFGETAMLTRYNNNADILAASAIFNALQSFAGATTTSALFSLFPLIGPLYGQSQNHPEVAPRIGALVDQSYWVGARFSAVTMLLLGALVIFNKPILKGLGQTDSAASYTRDFFLPFMFSLPATALLTSQTNFMLCVGEEKKTIYVSLFRGALELLLSYLFIYVGKMEVTGLGLAALIQPWIAVMVSTCYLKYYRTDLKEKYQLFSNLKPSKEQMKPIFAQGTPIFMQIGLELLIRVGLTLIAGLSGNAALGAYQIATQYNSFLTMMIIAISTAPRVLVARYKNSEERRPDVYRVHNTVLKIGVGITTAVLIAFAIIPQLTPVLTKAFIDSSPDLNAIIDKSKYALPMVAGCQVLFALRDLTGASLNGLGDPIPAFIGSVVGMWVISLPLSYLLSKTANLDLAGVIIAQGTGIGVGALGLWGRWRSKTREILETPVTPEQTTGLTAA